MTGLRAKTMHLERMKGMAGSGQALPETANLMPFYQAVVAELDRTQSAESLSAIARLISTTRIFRDHEDIADALIRAADRVGMRIGEIQSALQVLFWEEGRFLHGSPLL